MLKKLVDLYLVVYFFFPALFYDFQNKIAVKVSIKTIITDSNIPHMFCYISDGS